MRSDTHGAGQSRRHLRMLAMAVALSALALLAIGVVRVLADLATPDERPAVAVITPTTRPAATRTPATLDVPGSDVADLPRFPDSIRIGYRQQAEDGLLTTIGEYVVMGDLEDVHRYYRAIFAANGWVVADVEFSSDERYFFVVNGTREAKVTLEQDDNHVEVTVTLTAPLTDATVTVPSSTPTIPPTQTVVPPTGTPQQDDDDQDDDSDDDDVRVPPTNIPASPTGPTPTRDSDDEDSDIDEDDVPVVPTATAVPALPTATPTPEPDDQVNDGTDTDDDDPVATPTPVVAPSPTPTVTPTVQDENDNDDQQENENTDNDNSEVEHETPDETDE